MNSVLINYGTKDYRKTQIENVRSGLYVGGFDDAWLYGSHSIGGDFKWRNSKIFNQKRGGGYWIWKPYVILDALGKVDNDDVIVYSDSASLFVNSFSTIVEKCLDGKGVLGFQLEDFHKNSVWTKGDCFSILGANEYKGLPQIASSFVVAKKNDFSVKFISKWLEYCLDERALTDNPNQLQENFEDFKDHRHDQSIFSLCARMFDIDIHPDVTQWGVNSGAILQEDQLIDHHRMKL